MFGGRPMKMIRSLFMDQVAHRMVYLWEDKNEKKWMAFTKWDWDRVPWREIPERSECEADAE